MTQCLITHRNVHRLPLDDRAKPPASIAPKDSIKCEMLPQSRVYSPPMWHRMTTARAPNTVSRASVASSKPTESALSP